MKALINKFLGSFTHKNFGGRNFLVAVSGIVITLLMEGLDPDTRAWVIATICGGHSVSRGLADGGSGGKTASK